MVVEPPFSKLTMEPGQLVAEQVFLIHPSFLYFWESSLLWQATLPSSITYCFIQTTLHLSGFRKEWLAISHSSVGWASSRVGQMILLLHLASVGGRSLSLFSLWLGWAGSSKKLLLNSGWAGVSPETSPHKLGWVFSQWMVDGTQNSPLGAGFQEGRSRSFQSS